MGFDLSGLNPSNEKGEYFRNNVWWWRPLAHYVLTNVSLPEKERQYWGTNDGQKVTKKSALKIAKTLKKLIEEGHTLKYQQEYEEWRKSLPKHTCEYCQGTAIRKDLPDHPEGIQCNPCNGTGEVDDFNSNYPFTVGNVLDFAQFCESSGGFTIW